MARIQWKSLDEFDGPVPGRKDEFDEAVQSHLNALRHEYGITENGEISRPPGAADPASKRAADLRALLPPVSRRGFMQLTGAAAVFGLTGCWHSAPEVLVPYRNQPEGSTIGTPRRFSGMVRVDGRPRAVVATSYDGRPIALSGNPDCPLTRGGLDARGQATLLDVYDADRAQAGPRRQTDGVWQQVGWNELDAAVGAAIGDGKVGLLTGPWEGPSRQRLLAEWQATLGDRLVHAAWHPNHEDQVIEARRRLFGEPSRPVYQPEQAALVLTLGSDLIQEDLAVMAGLGRQRKLQGHGEQVEMGQLISIESTLSQTGTCADIRGRIAPELLMPFAWALVQRLAAELGAAVPSGFEPWAATCDPSRLEPHPALDQDLLTACAQRLLAVHRAGEHSLVYVGGAEHSGSGSLALHLAAGCLNSLLGNEGQTVLAEPVAAMGSLRDTTALLQQAAAGEFSVLIVVGVDPVFDFPDQALLQRALQGKPAIESENGSMLVVIGDRLHDTALQADIFLPSSHELESWGDAQPRQGLYYLQQPLVQRLWNNRPLEESLMAIAKAGGFATEAQQQSPVRGGGQQSAVSRKALWLAAGAGVQSWQGFVQQTFQQQLYPSLDLIGDASAAWRAALTTGVVGRPQQTTAALQLRADALQQLPALPSDEGGAWRLVLSSARMLGPGEQANNAFLQELPDPVSKITWDTYLAVSIADARQLELPKDAVVRLIVGETTVLVPVLVQAGMAAGCVELFCGYGRRGAGAVAAGGGIDDEQVNGYRLIRDGQRFGVPCQIELSDWRYELAGTQGHHYMDGRDIALDDVLESHRVDPDGHMRAHHHALWQDGTTSTDLTVDSHNLSLWDSTHVNTGRRWGMAIDMNTCNGCNACVVACQIENNIPVVGRDEVRLGREMHWMRIDRYYQTALSAEEKHRGLSESEKVEGTGYHYAGADDRFLEVIHQPMLCQHCSHAPCEEVCPAMATMHNDEGQNIQVYNRCIGTRYCANNCPYKVRRFNFYEYSKLRFGPQGSGDPLARVTKNLLVEANTTGSHELMQAPLQMMLNPEITLRSKGVMEKCSFCVSRTRKIREHEKRSNQKAPESMMQSACSATCPTKAITFGDIADPDSAVSRVIAANQHGYRVLDKMLNTRPAILYLRKVRNRPALADERVPDAHAAEEHG